ncbi:MAG: methyltransferase type 11 [uncultured bacterium]|nr:MAG: methyltransferase type 11 [uncultured bacterium]
METTIKKLNKCRLCKSNDYKVLFIKYGYEVAKCSECGLTFLNFDPDEKFFYNYYSEDFFNDPGIKHAYSDYEKEAESLKKSFKNRVDILSKYHGSGTLLDVGCATGAFMEVASSKWDVYGVDVSEYAVEQAKKKNLKAFAGVIKDSPYINQKFDVVTLWDTIEHVSDPLETIQQLSEMTKPGSIVALTTGDVGSFMARLSGKFWHLYNIPQHLSYFNKNTITRMFKESKFEVVEIIYPSIQLSLDYLLFRFVTFYKLKFAFSFYKLLKKTGILKPNLNINLYDIMLVVAKKV